MQSQRSQNNGNGRWTSQEHELFLEGLRMFGRDWKRIEQLVVSRSGAQIRSHAQKFFLKLKKFNEEGDNSLNTPEVTGTLEAPSSFSKIQDESIRIPKLSVPLESTSFFMAFMYIIPYPVRITHTIYRILTFGPLRLREKLKVLLRKHCVGKWNWRIVQLRLSLTCFSGREASRRAFGHE